MKQVLFILHCLAYFFSESVGGREKCVSVWEQVLSLLLSFEALPLFQTRVASSAYRGAIHFESSVLSPQFETFADCRSCNRGSLSPNYK
jgi:hypothetical protein